MIKYLLLREATATDKVIDNVQDAVKIMQQIFDTEDEKLDACDVKYKDTGKIIIKAKTDKSESNWALMPVEMKNGN